jgi:assimilatory nitrate reductase catalytic subunit
VQEAFASAETCDYADVLLPAASWGEKEGTVTNSERRISRVRAAVPPPGEARPDWQIAVQFASRIKGLLKKTIAFEYETAESIFNEHRETTRGRDLDIAGLSYELLERQGPQQWPFPEGAREGRKRLYEDGVFPTASGRARFVAAQYVAPAEAVDDAYPLRLTTGRLRDQWHSMTRSGLVPRLFGHSPEPEVAVHVETLSSLGLADGSLVRVSSRRGGAVLKVRASDEVRPGDAFIAMHWGANFMGGAGVNALTLPAIDPFSFQPELKHAAVRIERFAPLWRAVRVAPFSAELQRAVAPLLQRFDHAALSLLESSDGGTLRLELASADAPGANTLAALDDLFGAQAEDAAALGSRAVCACFGVGEETIRAALATGATLARVQRELKCGTNCGSCIPELRRLAAATAPALVVALVPEQRAA